ncbi:hypothetical protein PP7435_CHR4-0574 [Komagataella phaffii CBS 7435]|uniref:Protein SIP5 n=2 Tax=Komagataella phaffii TaxID=460519 RepID=C4R7T5_KOMPG|nr:uncharacterized protein PAS_chr4_0411 [Komagataella phaffii GS115]AOA64729.1 GQ67_04762T0 [Komagataella phaffii]CAH2450956.1 hypothetical protein BQ9382_C4-3010 [Komagataella phaffii CBS 7435]AOA70283.1 GQ68_04734T0 [Komagataella phaffii GS115]CAY71660.1 Protein of unknown function [Komagataella phaffii GS115]CCA40736.1 hypothetical protein PP7435_CHR4-0574 [Komagataella phaffii CBS 7435]
MGNVPTREEASAGRRASSFSYEHRAMGHRPSHPFSPPSMDGASLRKKMKGKDKDRKEKRRLKEEHAYNLIVRHTENVDGGFLAPYGTYRSNLDYDTNIVRNLIIDRRIAPFYTPLQDFEDDWSDEKLLEILRSLPLHAPLTEDSLALEPEDEDDHRLHSSNGSFRRKDNQKFKQTMAKKTAEWQQEAQRLQDRDRHIAKRSLGAVGNNIALDIPSDDLLLLLYRRASECPICFLYYPQFFNISRCCIQPICTECFVQIKRLDPHPPHDEEGNEQLDTNGEPETLISEPARCPFCASIDFGITYVPPPFRTGINAIPPSEFRSAITTIEELDENAIEDDAPDSSTTTIITESKSKARAKKSYSIDPTVLLDQGRHRRNSLPPNSPSVITTDTIRADWVGKLASAKSKLARRSATASAIHATSLITEEEHISNSQRRALRAARQNDEIHELEERMIEEALRLSLMENRDEVQRRRASAPESRT